MLRFHLKQSKTDPFGWGTDVVLGRTGCSLCPVAAVLTYAAARGSQPGPFFSAARALTKQEFVCEIRKVLVRMGLPDNEYAGHIGTATSATMAGVEVVDGKA